ncbi:MAG: glycosyltransferase family 2 protein [Bacteroidetes bacterium]|nr:glycosyltransferase family 2 protein [Fibrella sp.]
MAEREHVSREPLVSIITVHFNQIDVTLALLQSTRQLLHRNVEILVVDNGSVEQPLTPALLAPFPNARLITSADNLGFAGGNNLAMKQAKGDFFLLINNDTEVTPDLIGELLRPAASDATIGVVCPKIRYFSQPDMIQYAGYRPLNVLTGQTTCYGTHQADVGQFDQSGPTAFAHGAAMLIARAVWERVGGMHEPYFLYYEELDWSHRIRRAGFTIYYQATALIYHKESISVGKASPNKVYYLTRNRLYFMRRCTTPAQRRLFMLYFGFVALPKHLLAYTLQGRFDYLTAFGRGVIWNITHPTT